MRTNKKNFIKIIKNLLLLALAILVFAWAAFFLIGHYKIRSAIKNYYREYVKITYYNFSKYKKNASISISIENQGKRLLDSIIIKIDYYDSSENFIGSDLTDILQITKDVLYPGAGKVFRIDVTCPEETSNIKLGIK